MWYGPVFNCINLNLGGKAMKQSKLAEMKNNVTFQNIFVRLVKKALSRYEIEGLPETCSERVVKMALLYHGSVGFFEREGSVLALPATPGADITLNGDYTHMYVYGRNGYNEKIALYVPGADDSKLVGKGFSGQPEGEKRGVWVRENEMVYPFLNYCIDYADRISDTYRTFDIGRFWLKMPGVFVAEEEALPSIKSLIDGLKNNELYNVVSSGIYDVGKVNFFDLKYSADNISKCTDSIEWLYNDFDNLCFKNSNSNPDKKERLLVDEVNSNNESTEAQSNSFSEYLQEQFDFVNKCLGTNIKIKINKEEPKNENIQRVDRNAAGDNMGSVGSGDNRQSD